MKVRFFVAALVYFCGAAFGQDRNVTVTGTLVRSMAVGGESTGWTIKLEPTIIFEGKQSEAIEVTYDPVSRLNELQDKRVKASGTITYRSGVETGRRRILALSSVELFSESAAGGSTSESLAGVEWILEDLNGSGVLDNVQATLMIANDGKVSGSGSCNRFFGTATSKGNSIRFGQMATTRMACREAIMNQETNYLKALASAKTFEVSDSTLLLYSAGLAKPLRFRLKRKANGADLSRLSNRIWGVSSASSKAAPGSLYLFLSNGILLETSCVETYRIAQWSADKNTPSQLTVTEDNQPAFTAVITEGANGGLHMQQNLLRSNETRELTLKEVKQEHVCPDLASG